MDMSPGAGIAYNDAVQSSEHPVPVDRRRHQQILLTMAAERLLGLPR